MQTKKFEEKSHLQKNELYMQLNYTSSQSILYLTSTTKVICAKLCKQLREGLRKVYSGQWFRQGSLAVGHLICNHFSKCFKKSGSRKVVREQWFEKSGSRKFVDQKTRWIYTINHLFSGSRKVVDQKKNPSLQNHFSPT